MNIHEYQAKEILKNNNVAVPEGNVAYNVEEAMLIASDIFKKTNLELCAVKAQIHAGGRGKGGGIKIAKSLDEVKKFTDQIIGMNLITHQTGPKGKLVKKVLIEQSIYYPGNSEIKEYYMSILLNRNTSHYIIMYSTKGGMDIESVADKSPELIFKEEIDPKIGIQAFQARKIAYNLNLSGEAFKEMIKFVLSLYNAFIRSDASLFEINPVIKTSDDKIFAADAKVNLDDNAIFRHKNYMELRDTSEEDPSEVEASNYNLNFIKLDGNVGCMVNGAGLAMATMDVIKLSGGEPANFLDVGGNASADTVEAGFKIILQDPNVKAILINIFGGIVRCDRVAGGIIEAYKKTNNINIPVIIRLQGTNAEEAKKMIDKSGLKVTSVISLQEAADLVKKIV
ncbi:ADP-forming succinate--CoA ligase subunit beta [Bacteroidota bacterium]